MSKRLLIKLDSNNKQYPPIAIEISIPDDLGRAIEATPITSTTLTVADSRFITPAAQKEELKGDLNSFRIL